MPLRPGERCERCHKHINSTSGSPTEVSHYPPACDLCLPPNETLKTCNGCKLVRYCGKDCQKAHWREHKKDCNGQVELRSAATALGKDVDEMRASFWKWCEDSVVPLSRAAFHALGLHSELDRERLKNFTFLVIVHAQDATPAGSSSLKVAHSILTAGKLSMSDMHLKYDWRYGGCGAKLEKVLSPKPGMLRILVHNTALPVPLELYTLPMEVPQGYIASRYDPQWFAHLKEQLK